MIPVSNEYRRQLIKGNRNYLIRVEMTLADNTTLTLENKDIWEQGIVFDDATSSDNSFDIGTAIIGSLKVVIDNIKGNYSQYDFYDATLVLYMGVDGDLDENDEQRYYRKGFYVVDEPNYNGSLITLNCLDNMTWFDVPFENISTTNTTAGELVANICSHVGVLLGTAIFPNYTTPINVELKQELNCREVIQYVAQMCCCYCKIDRSGALVLKWYNKQEIIGITNFDGGTYDTTTTPYSDGCDEDGGGFMYGGDIADGGTFADLLDNAYLSNNFEINVSTDDIVVTGCRVRNSTSTDDSYDVLWVDSTLEQDHERYVLVIENNPFINGTNAANIANVVGSILAGLPIRGFKATSLNDFSYETGDMVTIIDFRGNRYYTWITHLTFTTNNSENFSCGVESLRKRSEERFSSAIKTLAEANANAAAALSEYDSAVKAMNELAQSAIGYYKYEHNITGGGKVTWLHNGVTEDTTDPDNPLFPNSTVVFKISGDGVFISHDGGTTYDQGYDANSGTAILSLIYAVGISCDWIKAGTLTLGGYNNQDGWLQILNASNAQIGYWDNTGIHATAGSFTGSISGSSISGSSFYLASGGDIVDISGGRIKTQGTWIQLCKTLADTDEEHLALGYHYSAYMNDSEGFFLQVRSKKIIQAADDYSDERLKIDIVPVDDEYVEELILNADIKNFKRTYEPTKLRFGVIAQDVRKQLDKLGIDKKCVELTDEDDEGYYSIDYKEYIPMLIRMTQKQQAEIDLLKQEIAELKARLD